jgi:hypothetical protein
MHIKLCKIKFRSVKTECILKLEEMEGVKVLELPITG